MPQTFNSRGQVGLPVPLLGGAAFAEYLRARLAVEGRPALIHHNPRALAQAYDRLVVLLVELGDALLARFAHVRGIRIGVEIVRIDLEAERIEGWIVSPETQSTDWAGSFVLFSTLELLRLRRVYAVHAAGLVKNGIGVIIAAPGGSGKTTSCLSLIRGGYRCLSDDHPLLRETKDGGVEMLAFRGRVAVTRKTVEWFPELQAAQAGFRQETVKRSFFLEQVWPDAAGAACQPRILIFPRVVDWPESSLEPMPRSRALEELLPQTLLVLDRELAARQFRTFAKLIQTVDCYRLHFGEDILGLPALFDQLIAAKTGSKAVSQREATP